MSGAQKLLAKPGTAFVVQLGAEENTFGPLDQLILSAEDLEEMLLPVAKM